MRDLPVDTSLLFRAFRCWGSNVLKAIAGCPHSVIYRSAAVAVAAALRLHFSRHISVFSAIEMLRDILRYINFILKLKLLFIVSQNLRKHLRQFIRHYTLH